MMKTKTKKITVYLEPSLYERLACESKKQTRTISNLASWLLHLQLVPGHPDLSPLVPPANPLAGRN